MKIDLNVSWDQVGGLKGHVNKLKEMILLPLLYPQEFASFHIQPPRGVIFHGPPGTGKTLVARVLASEASKHGQKVSFYMRKGADCLSKWVGEAERQLRMLFTEAYKNQPSIIFFDEIDGLAPVRSSRQDQIHSSIVSTLLALMDGLDKRGKVIVIGATNRIDSIDPALRRPGRFDRELLFNLPSRSARKHIFKIHTKAWDPPVDDELLHSLAEKTAGYCGADIEGLTREAFLHCFRRTYPQIYDSKKRLKLTRKLIPNSEDFSMALLDVVPSSKRSNVVYARPLPKFLQPLLQNQFEEIKQVQKQTFPLGVITKSQIANLELSRNSKVQNESAFKRLPQKPDQPRLLISGPIGYGQSFLGPAILHELEEFPTYSIDLPTLLGSPQGSADEVLFNLVKQARRNSPSILYWPRVNTWWECLQSHTRRNILELIRDTPDDVPVYVIATSEVDREILGALDQELLYLFPKDETVTLRLPDEQELREFWKPLGEKCVRPLQHKDGFGDFQDVPATPTPAAKMEMKSEEDEKKVVDARISEENLDFTRLRIYLRTVLTRCKKHFPRFEKAIQPDENNDIVSTDFGLQDFREIVNDAKDAEPMTVKTFLDQMDDLVRQVKDSYADGPDESDIGREYVNEACHLQDTCLTMVANGDANLFQRCQDAFDRRMTNKDGLELLDKNEPSQKKRKKERKQKKPAAKKKKPEKKKKNSAPKPKKKPVLLPPPPLFIGPERPEIDESLLKETMEEIIEKSKNMPIHLLRKWRGAFEAIVYRYSDQKDRRGLVKELSGKLQTLVQNKGAEHIFYSDAEVSTDISNADELKNLALE